MIVQACLNGARPAAFHPRLPLTTDDVAREAAAAVAAGAAELHVHPRDASGRESLLAVGEVVAAVRRACPGTLVGVSTGAWIEGDERRTLAAIERWDARWLPDHASVNLAERDAPAVMALLRARGVGIEAGLGSVADAERLVGMEEGGRVLRVLVEVPEPSFQAARDTAQRIVHTLHDGGVVRPVLVHGVDATVWPFVAFAARNGFSTRVGLEDGRHLPDGTVAPGNAELVAAASALVRGR